MLIYGSEAESFKDHDAMAQVHVCQKTVKIVFARVVRHAAARLDRP
ncbi:hypothetical protein [Streptomyces sp. NPDC058240]